MSFRNADGVSVERTGFRDNILNQRIRSWGNGFIIGDIPAEQVDTSISKRRRAMWGYNCPTTNVDCMITDSNDPSVPDEVEFLMYEYNCGRPIALIDYKLRHPGSIDYQKSTNIRAMKLAADGAKLPFFFAYYENVKWTFAVECQNDIARAKIASFAQFSEKQPISEALFVSFLYWMRNQTMPASIRGRLANCADKWW